MFVERDELGNPVDRNHPWNQTTIPKPQKRNFDDKYSWVMSPRWFDGKDHLAADTGGGPIARLWATALGGLVDMRLREVDRAQRPDQPAEDDEQARGHLRVEDPEVEQRARARPSPDVLPGLLRPRARCTSASRRWPRCGPGDTKTWESFTVPDEAFSCGFTEAVRGVLSHHMVIKGGKIANYHPYPPTPWNASVRDVYGTPGPYEDAVQNTPIFEENPPDNFKGIDVMRAVRSFDPCLPCGVHMYLGPGKTLQTDSQPDADEPCRC